MSEQPTSEVQLQLAVTGMTCPRCEARVEKALLATPGVSRAKADHQQDRCTVTYDPDQASPETLAQTVTESGYTASVG